MVHGSFVLSFIGGPPLRHRFRCPAVQSLRRAGSRPRASPSGSAVRASGRVSPPPSTKPMPAAVATAANGLRRHRRDELLAQPLEVGAQRLAPSLRRAAVRADGPPSASRSSRLTPPASISRPRNPARGRRRPPRAGAPDELAQRGPPARSGCDVVREQLLEPSPALADRCGPSLASLCGSIMFFVLRAMHPRGMPRPSRGRAGTGSSCARRSRGAPRPRAPHGDVELGLLLLDELAEHVDPLLGGHEGASGVPAPAQTEEECRRRLRRGAGRSRSRRPSARSGRRARR